MLGTEQSSLSHFIHKTTQVTHINPILEECDLKVKIIADSYTSRSVIVMERVTYINCASY